MVWPSFFIVTNEGGLKLFTVQQENRIPPFEQKQFFVLESSVRQSQTAWAS
jgi:hypothetical protein